ncbi:MAG: SLBB domain-containing protein [Bacteroidaceae bacterium]|nr:SLBB domain-containing protein [Bacteroidaceae bacterium]
MRKLLIAFLVLFGCSGIAVAQTMSDEQVIEYVLQAQEQGKTQTQIVKELMRRGVTMDQVNRLKTKYNKQDAGVVGNTESFQKVRTRTNPAQYLNGQKNQEQLKRDYMIKAYQDKQAATTTKPQMPGMLTPEQEMLQGLDFIMPDSMDMYMELYKEKPGKQIFGRNIFNNKNLSFEPNLNIATPQNYRLGPGDEVIIDIWGASQNTIQETISPDGAIQIEFLGPVYLSGMTVKEANEYLQESLSKIYSGIADKDAVTKMKLTVGQIRTIQVNVLGEVENPGTYTLSSFASVFHALYQAGGTNEIGSLRAVKVYRENQLVATLDIYDYILNGQMSGDIRLADGDVVVVDTYDCLVNITGKVKRPMFYEMKKNESVGKLLQYTGGFTGDAYTKNVRLVRKSGREYQIYNVDEFDFHSFQLLDGDSLSVDSVIPRFSNMVEIKGAVYRPGMYQMDGRITTVKGLIEIAEGLMGDAFVNRAVLHRKRSDLSLEVISVDVKGIMEGVTADIPLHKEDVLMIPSIHDIQEDRVLTIYGEVAFPGTYVYAANTSLEDLVLQAGGLKEAASTVRVDVSRRIKDADAVMGSNETAQTFSFSLRDGFVVDGEAGFVLEPFDEVYVRRSPGYHEQQNVKIEGEVLFAGTYVMHKKNYRLSELIKAAGGLTDEAYPKGARLERQMTPEEQVRMKAALRMSKVGADSIDVDKLDLSTTYSVGIELDKAIANPGGEADIVLTEGDRIVVPQYINTVKINGEVMYPNTVSFTEGKKIKHYIEQAGGYSQEAKKSRAYVVYMNGTIARAKGGGKDLIQPGCEIIVPAKGERKGLTLPEIMSIGTSTASLATMIATIANLIK